MSASSATQTVQRAGLISKSRHHVPMHRLNMHYERDKPHIPCELRKRPAWNSKTDACILCAHSTIRSCERSIALIGPEKGLEAIRMATAYEPYTRYGLIMVIRSNDDIQVPVVDRLLCHPNHSDL